MARRIEKHATRLSQQHQAASDPGFAVGQRVQTIDGLPGRVLFAAASFSPGLTEYEVMLDHGMGQGTYTATQLRLLPADFRSGPQGSNLPAGVTAAFEAEAADAHTADLDYPEMGDILRDRPDPGQQIQVIGSRRTAADSYGGAEDPRDEDYEGGANDTGVHWSAPAQQGWMHENEPPQEEAPPPVFDDPEMSPVMARLAQIEEACQLVGTRHSGALVFGTTINGTEIDGHGDAPEHGTAPRADDPEGYDGESTEGEEDEEQSEPLHPGDNEKYRGATSGMWPGGVSDGGLGMAASRVPWTGHERTELHKWDNGASTTWGDFVPSTMFTNRQPVTEQIEDPAPDVIEQELQAQAVWRAAAASVAQEHDEPALDEATSPDEPDDDGVPDGVPGDEDGQPSDDPADWPMAQAEVTSGGTALTQGKDDGQRPWGGHKHRSTDSLAPTVPKMMNQLDQATQKVQDQQGQIDKLTPDAGGEDQGDGGQSDSDQHLAAFTAAAASPAFRFEFTAAWRDVLAKANRIRKAGRVRLTHVSSAMVIGEVAGDHDTYESGIQRPPGHPQTIQHWACGCPWATFNQDSSLGTRYAGRPCSHVMAIQLEAQSRSMFGREIDTDPTLRELGHDPYPVVVRSAPPWTENGWAQHWLAPAASLQRTAEMFCPSCGDDRDDAGRCYGCGKVSHDPREASATVAGPDPEPGEEGWEEHEEEQAEQEQDHKDGCYYEHEGPCLTFGGPPGLHSVAESLRHSRPRGYTSSIEPNADRDPDSYWAPKAATHVLKGHIDGEHWGSLHFSVSDDGKAHQVDMLASGKTNTGLGSAMMDDLYSHVKAKGGWINHGVRTDEGNDWWSKYREPHPGISTHHAHPDEGWHKYFDPGEVAADAHSNHENSGGRGAHTPLSYSPGNYQNRSDPKRDSEWTEARSVSPSQRAVAALVTAGEDLAEIIVLARLAGVTGEPFRFTADQANGAWGSENVSQHPPAKPYGATEPPNKDQDPGSYGFLSGPDPDNWGSIQENQLYQTPLSTDAALAELHEEPEPALPETTAEPAVTDQAQADPGADGGSMTPDDQSIQSMGAAQTEDDIVAAFQRSAAARGLSGGGGPVQSDGDIAARAREFLKTAEVLPEAEAAALISEGRGERARNLSLLKLEGTHYAEQDDDLHGRGLTLDDFDDDVVVA